MSQAIFQWQTALRWWQHRIRVGYRFYSQDLINNLFSYPYTRIEFVERDESAKGQDSGPVQSEDEYEDA